MNYIIGFLILAMGVVNLFIDLRNRKTCSAQTTATIVEVKRKRRNRRNSYQPIYEFYADGRTIRGDGGVLSASFRNKYKVGDTVEIYYNEAEPEKFRVPGKIGMLLTSALMIVVGVGIIYMAVNGQM